MTMHTTTIFCLFRSVHEEKIEDIKGVIRNRRSIKGIFLNCPNSVISIYPMLLTVSLKDYESRIHTTVN